MSRDPATALRVSHSKRKRLVLVAAALLGALVVGYAAIELIHWRASQKARRQEDSVLATIRALGGEFALQLSEEMFPLGRIFPGQTAARYRYAIKLRNPLVTDDQLAVLDRLDPDRVAMLDLLCGKLGDPTLARASRFPKLTLLGLGQARSSPAEAWPTNAAGLFTEQGFACLDRLPELETLGLHGPDFTDAALAHLRGANALRVLILYGTRVTGKGLAALGPKPDLTTLKLGGTKCGDADLAALENFPNLEVLDLRDTAITDAGVAQLQSLKRLKLVILAGCPVSDAAVDALKSVRPGLVVGRDDPARVPASNASN